MIRLLVISAGAGDPSSSRLLGDRLAAASKEALVAAGEQVEVEHLELRTLAIDLAKKVVSRVPSARLDDAFDAVLTADGVIAVTPVYNGSYAGLFKMFFDVLDENAMRGRPVLAAATGGSPRHSLVIEHAVLPMFFYLKAPVAPHPVFAAASDWSETAHLDARIRQSAASFAHVVRVSVPLRVHRANPSELDDAGWLNLAPFAG